MNIFKKLLKLWIWLIVVIIASSASFAYDFQHRANDAYDDPITGISGYDGAAMFTGIECASQSVISRTLSATFATFLAAEGAVATADSAQNVVNGARLADDLTFQSAQSTFNADGTLSQGAINNAKQIFAPGTLGNPEIPAGFGKYTTESIISPSGDFQVHFYMNPTSGEVYYGLDYKSVFNKPIGH